MVRLGGIYQGAQVATGCDTKSTFKVGLTAIARKDSQSPSALYLLGTPQGLGSKHLSSSRYCLGEASWDLV